MLHLKKQSQNGILMSFILISIVFKYAVFKSTNDFQVRTALSGSSRLPCVKEKPRKFSEF